VFGVVKRLSKFSFAMNERKRDLVKSPTSLSLKQQP